MQQHAEVLEVNLSFSGQIHAGWVYLFEIPAACFFVATLNSVNAKCDLKGTRHRCESPARENRGYAARIWLRSTRPPQLKWRFKPAVGRLGTPCRRRHVP